MFDNALNSGSNFLGLFPVASKNFISCFIAVESWRTRLLSSLSKLSLRLLFKSRKRPLIELLWHDIVLEQWVLVAISLPSEVESSRTSLASRTHFKVLGLGLEASSPWPWPRSLRFLKIALSSTALFLNRWNFVGKRQKFRGKFVNTFFILRNWSIGLAKQVSPPIEILPMTKMWQKSLLFLQFQFLFSVFRVHQ